MNQRQLCHIWAQQTKTSGKSESLFFDRDTIYSYWHHFPIARFASQNVVLFTSRGYSMTTAKHKAYVSQSLGGQRRFTVPDVMAETKEQHAKNFKALRDEIDDALKSLPRRRDKPTAINIIERQSENANEYAKTFKLRQRIKLPADIEQAAKEVAEVCRRRDAAVGRPGGAAYPVVRYWEVCWAAPDHQPGSPRGL